ncbi:DUF550 domain-containing protein [Salmonella enterica]|uniref:Phage EaA protein n=1 Tax=Salmonella enterica subsp. enterica serovar Rubislaw str. A4-653 TaxID=913081 RepID=G5QFN0_SALRU|nr:dATP/dGTP pyrophosphohydrolase domain-containing protein [Salmonella enterica]EDB6796030.1 DUF550 domain-containing protein [Salmonella enterica subsp. enterica serovar Muenchen]EDF8135430.1 DUF550 domain-containing protein [Salmonella enterica subsp. enterica serovar Litchfield]EDS5863814.1 DUF550 domain-containing protein [Salmonella enterica subsp. enterica serovar Gaminara]EDT7926944.1 DUF550 domain-containing protein [Salmonella enterica subsp. enterica]EHC93012.1 Phage EaA protein [Sa
MTTITREQQKQILIDTANHVISRDNTSPYSENLRELARIALASLDADPVSQPYKLPEEKGASLQLRNLIRKRHAEWSDSTFGNVGPVGPLKHLSKEALEAAAEPGDLSEWADMQFLLWDAQRRAGITDEQIALAMVEKLAVNKKREWPEPKDGEPRLHIKEQSAPVIPDGWISCSERMPEDEQEVIVHNKLGYRYVSYFDEHSGLFFDMRGGNQMNCIEHILVTHWMPLPAAPEPEQS